MPVLLPALAGEGRRGEILSIVHIEVIQGANSPSIQAFAAEFLGPDLFRKFRAACLDAGATYVPTINGNAAIIMDESLEQLRPEAFAEIMRFAAENRLQIRREEGHIADRQNSQKSTHRRARPAQRRPS